MSDYFNEMKNKCINILHESFFKNSLLIMMATLLSAVTGFIFWIFAAKLYTAEVVGLTTALISSLSLIIQLSRLGLDTSLIRFFPENNKSNVFSTTAIITTLLALIFGFIFIVSIDFLSPSLYFIKSTQNFIIVMIFLATSSLTGLSGTAFIAIRKAGYYLLQNITMSLRILFIFPFVYIGEFGIFSAFGLSLIVTVVVALIMLERLNIKPKITIDSKFLRESLHYSIGNYIANFLMIAPSMILPLMILNIVGAEQAAYYFIAFAISSVLFMIPSAVATSLFVEGSNGQPLKEIAQKSMLSIILYMVPTIAIIYFSGGWILEAIGNNYADAGLNLLKIISITSLFVGVTHIYFAIKKVKKDVNELIFLNILISSMLLGFSYIFITKFGIIGVGYAWFLSYLIICMVISLMVWRQRWFN